MAERPNFVVYMTDQHRADCLGCYGHPVLQTPNIDGLAKVGMTFDNFYVSSPVCMPEPCQPDDLPHAYQPWGANERHPSVAAERDIC